VVLDIVKYGHTALREKGVRIKQITPELRQLAADMIETMYAADGVGLAAQQVGRPLLLTVIDISTSEQPGQMLVNGHLQDVKTRMPLVLVNPQLSHAEGEQIGPEGCLSIPEVNADIRRAAKIHVRAQTLEGAEITFDCTGLLARAAQHEMDHLNGILFTDRMDAATRASLAGKLKKLQKETLSQLAKTAKPPRRLVRS
jgi:peptide deformylase